MILALDVSLTATGWARSDGKSGVLSPPKGQDRGVERLRWFRQRITGLAARTYLPAGTELEGGCRLVVIEGYSFGSKGNALYQIGELGGVIRVALTDLAIPYIEVPPSSLKLFATGKGNAPKDEVLAAAIRKLGYVDHDHNEADALWLLAMARMGVVADHPALAPKLADHQKRALEKIQWPRLHSTTDQETPSYAPASA